MCDDTAAPSAADEQERHLPGSGRAHLSDVPDDRVREVLALEQINQVGSLLWSKRATPSATASIWDGARKRVRAHLRLRPDGPDHLEPLLQQLVDNVDSHEPRGAGHEDLWARSSQNNMVGIVMSGRDEWSRARDGQLAHEPSSARRQNEDERGGGGRTVSPGFGTVCDAVISYQ